MDGNYLLMLLCFLVLSNAIAKKSIETDQSALLALKSSISRDASSGNLLSNWNEGTSVCSWIGVQCSPLHNRVVALNISYLDLGGAIPPHIGNISFLRSFDIDSNHFQGQLPVEIAKLRRLAYFSFNSNNISGGIPGWFGSLPELKYLDLRNNSFSGRLPSSLFNATKLEILDLSSNQLSGYIPEEVGDLVNLRTFFTGYNQLEGLVPPSVFNLTSLKFMSFRHNRLTGHLPLNICTKLPNLVDLHLSYNNFSGQVQSRFNNCSKLEILSLSYNNFSGLIPREICNLTMLVRLDAASNGFQGLIPTEISDLQMLSVLFLSLNYLSGPIPPSIFNQSSLSIISLALNNLTGTLPLNIGHQLPNLEELYIGSNNLGGVIPNSISNLTNLLFFYIAQNQFTGSFPTSLGNLRFLRRFSAWNNFLTTDSSMELDFFASLTGCTSLTLIDVSRNPLNIPLSPSIGNFSSSLRQFSVNSCGMRGHIPPIIGNLSGLLMLNLGRNNFTGLLPPTLRNLFNLQGVYLHGNQITGFIPNTFSNMRQLDVLNLQENQFYGQISESFGNMTSLRKLYLDNNRLNSTLPTELGTLRDLLILDVSSNFLSGNITPAVGSLRAAIRIDLSGNNFSGDIPQSIGGLNNLNWLSLARNQLKGSIPLTFQNLLSLQALNLSENNLTGEIPASLEMLSELKDINLSFNHLRGRVPSNGSFLNFSRESFMANDALCGGIPDLNLPPCILDSQENNATKKKRFQTVASILIPTAALVILIFGVFVWWIKKRDRKTGALPHASLTPSASLERISFYEIQRGTNGFSESNLLGIGYFGRVYKGVLRDGTNLAIKVFNLQLVEAFKSFETECEVLRSIRHRNIVKVISCCSNLDFKALILEYMPNGSLEKWLYSHNHFLDFMQRLDIMIDVASALNYLHHGFTLPIVHCDLKPSNILLSERMSGHVSDFGISKLLGEQNVVQTMTVATIGYTAPEYGSEGLVSTCCDMYSFGILLMETYSRKKPTDDMFGEEWGLKEMIITGLQASTTDYIDDNLISTEDRDSELKVKCLEYLMDLALNCAVELPKERINASHVLAELQKIKLILLSNSERIRDS